jgi:hypothetical protein
VNGIAPVILGRVVRIRARQDKNCVVLGHRLDVYCRPADQWRVAVDGAESLPAFAHSYAAWAAGVAESYRLGRRIVLRPFDD